MRFLALLFIAAASPALAQPPKILDTLQGKVVSVTDGDTVQIQVEADKAPLKVRLDGIDAPEKKQAFGEKSKYALSYLVYGKEVTLEKTGEDRYGRTLGIIKVDGVNANSKMIEYGWAWHYKEYNKDERLAELEANAREQKRGLWLDATAPVPPWDYRKGVDEAKLAEAKPMPETKPVAKPKARFWLNTKTGVRHRSHCRYFEKTGTGRYCEEDEGKPCGICKG